ncbi:1,3-beta-galactosyl-N-acetylhexosamine phosphorylase [Neobacillus rhizosphaerae]|uniref:1,3-beta-galactosyl-N-acetylhexosamine phosphorylase n=1 Tax=Neobacillus rhizosphaerae TaxID=2880965 RepID=A0ABM9ESI6_9BACI|nr:1,3-beta-galactosyl-N-acetylhexosamine phosphorylase [Neobacillus rhizosphaerae]CAH2715616.1 1,3-beta-galactosyl-N-acetylhexosamine phosphorylase [Neobacillus rhizosphaerae]
MIEDLRKGRFTLPAETGIDNEVKRIIEKWGADAIRNSDGTILSKELMDMAVKVYTTYLTVRNDQQWAYSHRDQLQMQYLMSKHNTAANEVLEIDLLDGYFNRQFEIDKDHDIKRYWEVIDRTSGELLDVNHWEFDCNTQKVVINNAKKWHRYTVSFLAYQVWDTTQMYNHLTNNWTTAPEMPYDAIHEETREHIFSYLDNWLKENPSVDVVRFTTFFYHFTIAYNDKAKEKFVDWFGYSASVSPKAMDEFEKVKGYRLRAEAFVDEGYYNSPFRVPSKEFLDWIDFVQGFVAENAKKCVDLCHSYGKEAMMFLGDNWIGTEPYGDYFGNIGLDSVVGSVGSGATLRLISDIPHVKYTEGRFLPYFFPDTFYEGGNPTKEAVENWVQARRAILRKPVERMGYGGYLSLALKFPEFVEKIEEITNEFREIHYKMEGTKAYTAKFKVAVLNAWGKLRSWQTNMVAHALWYKKIYSYVGVIECLSGMPVDVVFMSFEDIKKKGIPEDIGVIINAGDAGTAWSGDKYWVDDEVTGKLREWVHNGGGFIGIGEPTAYQHQGKYFQLSDILGVDREMGYTLSYTRHDKAQEETHFILQDQKSEIDFGEGMKYVYRVSDSTQILSMDNGDINLAVNEFGKGRAVYISGLPYTPENVRILLRALYWAAAKEEEMFTWYTSNSNTECAAYLQTGNVAIINNSDKVQETEVYRDKNSAVKLSLNPYEIKWICMEL